MYSDNYSAAEGHFSLSPISGKSDVDSATEQSSHHAARFEVRAANASA